MATRAEPFAAHPHVFVAPPGHPLLGRGHPPLQTLQGYKLIRREEGSGTRAALDHEFDAIRRQGYALDAEEFVDGLVCIAVPVRAPGERAVRCALALQAPAARVSLERLPAFLGRLNEAAVAVARTL